MAIEKFFAQIGPLRMETEALRLSLTQIEKDMEFSRDDRELYSTYINLKADVLSRLKRITEMKTEAEELIERVENSLYRTLLRHRFINCKTAEEVAEIMGYDVRHIYRLQKKAIEAAKEAVVKKYF